MFNKLLTCTSTHWGFNFYCSTTSSYVQIPGWQKNMQSFLSQSIKKNIKLWLASLKVHLSSKIWQSYYRANREGGGGSRADYKQFCDFLTGVPPDTNYFVIFQLGSGYLLGNFVIFYRRPGKYDIFFVVFRKNCFMFYYFLVI